MKKMEIRMIDRGAKILRARISDGRAERERAQSRQRCGGGYRILRKRIGGES